MLDDTELFINLANKLGPANGLLAAPNNPKLEGLATEYKNLVEALEQYFKEPTNFSLTEVVFDALAELEFQVYDLLGADEDLDIIPEDTNDT